MGRDNVEVVCLGLGDGYEMIGHPRDELAHVEDIVDVAHDLQKNDSQ